MERRFDSGNTHPASAEVDLSIPYDAHNRIYADLIDVSNQLRGMEPEIFQRRLSGIQLQGEIPLTLKSTVGQRYYHASLNTYKSTGPEQIESMTLSLHGRSPLEQVELISSNRPVDFGRNKQFGVKPSGSEQVIRYIDCEDICLLLDDIIPDVDRRFSNLVDPRNNRSFSAIAVAIGDILSESARNSDSSKEYTASDYAISGTDLNYFSETEVALRLFDKDGRKACVLELATPLSIGQGQVRQVFTYQFINQPVFQGGKVQQPYIPNVKITLSSEDYTSKQLNRYVIDPHLIVEPERIIERALTLLIHEKIGNQTY